MASDQEDDQAEMHAELTGLLLSEQTVSGLLEMIVELATSAIDDVSGSSISLMSPHGRLETSNASSETIRIIDEGQYQDGNGPCVQAINTGTEVTISLPSEQWPEFSIRAQQAGMGSVYSLPLQVRHQTTGALNLYSKSEQPIAGNQVLAAVAWPSRPPPSWPTPRH